MKPGAAIDYAVGCTNEEIDESLLVDRFDGKDIY